MTNKEIAERYSSFCALGEDGALEMYLDNHMLSAFRECQGYFEEQFLSHPNQMFVPTGRTWSLEFGQYFHKCMEYFYQGQRDDWEGVFQGVDNSVEVKQDFMSFLQICSDLWTVYDLDFYMSKEFEKNIGKSCRALGGHEGALTLFTQYYRTHFRQERFRFVGQELSFGRNKEVLIGEWNMGRFYYCGRIDMIVDDSIAIGPMDHKTTSYFDGEERDNFTPDDGMQGYVFSVQRMLGEAFKEQGKVCNTMIINHISVRAPSNGSERFKKSYILYTPLQMDRWQGRQMATFKQIYRVLSGTESVTWDTAKCNNWHHRKCSYKMLHETAPAFRDGIAAKFYQIKDAWNPYNT